MQPSSRPTHVEPSLARRACIPPSPDPLHEVGRPDPVTWSCPRTSVTVELRVLLKIGVSRQRHACVGWLWQNATGGSAKASESVAFCHSHPTIFMGRGEPTARDSSQVERSPGRSNRMWSAAACRRAAIGRGSKLPRSDAAQDVVEFELRHGRSSPRPKSSRET